MSHEGQEAPLPLYRSTEMVRAAVIVGAQGDQVQIEFPRYGDDVPIIKTISGRTPELGDFYVVDQGGPHVITGEEFRRRYRAASNDAPREPMGIVMAYARVGYETARASQDGVGPPWEALPEVDRMALTATARAILDNPHLTPAETHDLWRNVYATQGVANPAADVAYGQLSTERKRATRVFRAAVAALK